MKSYTDVDKLKADLLAMGWRHYKLTNDQGDCIKFNQMPGKAAQQVEDICAFLQSDATIKGTYTVSFKRTVSDVITSVRFEKLNGSDPFQLPETLKKTPAMNADQIIELAVAKVEIKYLTQNNQELKAEIAQLKTKIAELEGQSTDLADSGTDKLIDLADKFAPTINTLAEALLNRFMPPPAPAPALPAFSDFQNNQQNNQAQQASEPKPSQQSRQNQIVRGSEQHYNYIRHAILSGALEDDAKAPFINAEIQALADRNETLYNKLIEEFDDGEETDINDNRENRVEEE